MHIRSYANITTQKLFGCCTSYNNWHHQYITVNRCVLINLQKCCCCSSFEKPNLDPTFNYFRPISNLSFLSKLVERVAANQLTIYMNQNDLGEPLQSAYTAFHKTETALFTIQNDILRSIDDKKIVLLLMLDLSAAFDTVDHAILLSRLESRFGITGAVLSGCSPTSRSASSMFK